MQYGHRDSLRAGGWRLFDQRVIPAAHGDTPGEIGTCSGVRKGGKPVTAYIDPETARDHQKGVEPKTITMRKTAFTARFWGFENGARTTEPD